MPLPLPNLDTRRWADLVDEGRALIPRNAPGWTDHNVHDPGITLLELFAWEVESAIYRANRVTDRARRKFLPFIGYPPAAPLAARLVVSFAHTGAPLTLPGGIVIETPVSGAAPLRAVLELGLTLVEATLVTLLICDGASLIDQSRALAAPLGVALLGVDPHAPARTDGSDAPWFALGVDRPLPVGSWTSLDIELADDAATRAAHARAAAERAAQRAACAPSPRACPPIVRGCGCPDGIELTPPAPIASSCTSGPRTRWEFYGPGGWTAFTMDDVEDGTDGLTVSGIVRLRVHEPMIAVALGGVPPRCYLRCILAGGAYDAAPRLVAIALNGAIVRQAERSMMHLPIAAGATLDATPLVVGAEYRLDLAFDPAGRITRLVAAPQSSQVPLAQVVEYVAPTATNAGEIILTLTRLDDGSGLPAQRLVLPDTEIVGASVWTLESDGWHAWRERIDLDASSPVSPDFTLDPDTGTIGLGDGERGRVAPAGSPIIAGYEFTRGAAGTIARGTWRLADVPINRSLLGAAFEAVAADVAPIGTLAIACAGADQESFAHAAGRAAAALWAHEQLVQLVQLAGDPPADTLDGLDPAIVRATAAPERAATTLDFERIALDVPATTIRRARAWRDLDPSFPGLRATGTVTVVIVPELPAGQPQPCARLLRRVRRYLDRRRVIGTRLVVTGPTYVEVIVTASVSPLPGADATRVQADVATALSTFLQPLDGGSLGRGWPFGRDVYRAEVMQAIDNVPGVDHVVSLSMTADGVAVTCSNICVPPTALVRSGAHVITVTR